MSFQDRRFEPRSPASARGVLVAPGLEMACLIADVSATGLKVRLDRQLALPKQVQIVDVAQGVAMEAELAWAKGHEAGFKRTGQPSSLRGLTPSRLTAARAAWIRAGGR